MLNPLFDKHSIELVSLACEFTAEIDKAGLELIRGESKIIQRKLPFRRVRRKGVSAANAHDLGSTQPEIMGYMFVQKTIEEETEIFELSGDRASFTSKAYSSFDSFTADSFFYLQKASEAFALNGGKLKRVMLRYIDSFSGDDMNWEPYDTLREGSPYIPAPVVIKGEFWHCEAGFFIPQPNPLEIVLNNYKLEHTVAESKDDSEKNEFFLKTYLLHLHENSDSFKESDFLTALKSSVEKLRMEHRKIFSGLISDKLAARIGLITPAQGE